MYWLLFQLFLVSFFLYNFCVKSENNEYLGFYVLNKNRIR